MSVKESEWNNAYKNESIKDFKYRHTFFPIVPVSIFFIDANHLTRI